MIVLLALWFWRGCGVQHPEIAGENKPAPTVTPKEPAPTASSASTQPAAATASAAATTPSAPETAPTPEHRMRALMFTMDASGIRLDQSQILNGRAKAPPLSGALYRLEFEVYDRDGRKIYEGSVDHPRRKVYEYEDPQRPGTMRRQPHEVESDSFQLRLPAELNAARIQFFETLPTRNRVPLHTFNLP